MTELKNKDFFSESIKEEKITLASIANNHKSILVYQDELYSLGLENGKPYLDVDGKKLMFSCHPYEPCLYITDENGFLTAVHNAFDPNYVIEAFFNGEKITSISGRNYDAKDFCIMVEYASHMGDTDISYAEKVFVGSAKNELRSENAASHDLFESDDPFYLLIDDYPDLVVDYCIVKNDREYRGYSSHRRALAYACLKLFPFEEDEQGWSYDVEKAKAEKISADEFLSVVRQNNKPTYRRAFLFPPYEIDYIEEDFEKINKALFPNGKDCLEVYEWTTDWSDYFYDEHNWQGSMCVSVYDRCFDRFVIICASPMD